MAGLDRARTCYPDLSVERLESRNLLAGNVLVFVDQMVLLVVGDDQANQVQISSDSGGNVVVQGAETT